MEIEGDRATEKERKRESDERKRGREREKRGGGERERMCRRDLKRKGGRETGQ